MGVLAIDLSELKAALEPSPTALLDILWRVLPRTASELYEAFSSQVHGAISALSRKCTCAEEYVEQLAFLESFRVRHHHKLVIRCKCCWIVHLLLPLIIVVILLLLLLLSL